MSAAVVGLEDESGLPQEDDVDENGLPQDHQHSGTPLSQNIRGTTVDDLIPSQEPEPDPIPDPEPDANELNVEEPFNVEEAPKKKPKIAIIAAVLIILFITIIVWFSLVGGSLSTPRKKMFTKVSSANYRSASVASGYKICCAIGIEVLKEKGTAIDAGLATAFCEGVLGMNFGGIGGGGFSLIYDKKKDEMKAIDGRDEAPWEVSEDMFVGENKSENSILGGQSIAVPGTLAGFIEIHNGYGTLPWKRLVMPSVKLLRDGFPLPELMQDHLQRLKKEVLQDRLPMFINASTDEIKEVGSIIKIPKLAKTYERIAEDKYTFYNGSLAEDIAADIKEDDGIITIHDIRNYRAKVKAPVEMNLPGGKKVYSVPPPSSGAVLSHILGILAGYKMTTDDISDEKKTILTDHRIVEAMKYAFAGRSSLGDEDFVDVKQIVENLTSLTFGESIRKLIDDAKTYAPTHYKPAYANTVDAGTIKVAVLDSEGNGFSSTQSINLFFGSQVIGKRTGIVFNCQMDDFATPGVANSVGFMPSPANFIASGKRPMSSMSPAMIWDTEKSKLVLVTATSGGPRIITLSALMIIRNLWLGQSVAESVERPRFHHQLFPNVITLDPDFSKNIKEGLSAKGHRLVTPTGEMGTVVLRQHDDHIEAASDFRGPTAIDGY